MLTDLKDAFIALDKELENQVCQAVTIQHLDVEDDNVNKRLIVNYTLPYGDEEITEQYIVDGRMNIHDELIGFKENVLFNYETKYYPELESVREDIRDELLTFERVVADKAMSY